MFCSVFLKQIRHHTPPWKRNQQINEVFIWLSCAAGMKGIGPYHNRDRMLRLCYQLQNGASDWRTVLSLPERWLQQMKCFCYIFVHRQENRWATWSQTGGVGIVGRQHIESKRERIPSQHLASINEQETQHEILLASYLEWVFSDL